MTQNTFNTCIITVLLVTASMPSARAGTKVYVGSKVPAGQQVSLDRLDHSAWDAMVRKYVDDEGMVDYRAWKASAADTQALDAYLQTLSSASLKSSAAPDARLAFWINAYNAVTVRGILREYPTTSIRNHTAKVLGYNIWKDLQLYVGGRPHSLDQMEHQVLRKMGEPRIHFAIVCASIGCPRLLNEAYVSDRIQDQLEANARDFFSRPRNFRYDRGRRTFFLSSILSWFGKDFGTNQAAQLRRIARWLPDEASRQAAQKNAVKVSFGDYDWSLNEQSTQGVAPVVPPIRIEGPDLQQLNLVTAEAEGATNEKSNELRGCHSLLFLTCRRAFGGPASPTARVSQRHENRTECNGKDLGLVDLANLAGAVVRWRLTQPVAAVSGGKLRSQSGPVGVARKVPTGGRDLPVGTYEKNQRVPAFRMNLRPELLLSLPPQMCAWLQDCEPATAGRAYATHDPADAQLSSGGGAAYVLEQAWRHRGSSAAGSFDDWIASNRHIVVHGGGESRRLPAYAVAGKLFIPIPALRWARGQRLGQTLLDLNETFLRHVFQQAGSSTRVMIASGDVLLRTPGSLGVIPDADVVLLGMWASPEVAQNYGVLFCDRHDPQRLLTFLQKPGPDEIRERSRKTAFLIDVGVWLLSLRAVGCLMSKCGWIETTSRFARQDVPDTYDLYGQWALHLGEQPHLVDDRVSRLSVAVAPIRQGEFYHFGTTGDVIDSMYALQNVVQDQTVLGFVPSLAQPRQFIQDAEFGVPVRRQENESLWVENSYVPATWKISKRHMLTGVPPNDWVLQLPEGTCLDFVPIGDDRVAIRPYGFSDRFRGRLSDATTQWMERPAVDWLGARGLQASDSGSATEVDLQQAALFPVLRWEQLSGDFVQWLIDPQPPRSADSCDVQRSMWLSCPKASARELCQRANLPHLYRQRISLRQDALPVMAGHGAHSIFYNLDLCDVARIYAASKFPLPPPADESGDLMLAIHDRMFRSEVLKKRKLSDWQAEEAASFRLLERAVVSPYEQQTVRPACRLADDQIVWARSPARIDLAGGWSDTPPYCIEHGGGVVNLAVNLNGQPPIQVFVRRCREHAVTIRSIDLGISEVLTTYDDVGDYRGIGSGFSVARAALALGGFHPKFNGAAYDTLHQQLKDFGGGVDVSLLAAIPQGSGLGTSSILAATVLGALSELCGLGWDVQEVAARVSAVEQMLGSGGGWQDQFGGLLHGAKLIETQPGLAQQASIRWLPTDFFGSHELASRTLLYYTGITRVAHDVLGEIVRGMFLNDPRRLGVLEAIRSNSRTCFEAALRSDIPAFSQSIRQSWELNQRLDQGTNPPQVTELVERIQPFLCALKLAGAGGGGFLYLIAQDVEKAKTVQRELERNPPNERARFVELSISSTGLQVTKS